MNNRLSYFLFLFMLCLIINSCGNKEVNSPESKSFELVTHVSNGCISIAKEDARNRANDNAIIETMYSGGQLDVNLHFNTHCSAEMKDSVNFEGNTISIFLEDTNESGSRCTCNHKEQFMFTINDLNEITIIFNYKAYASTDYLLMADTLITIN